ncbi:Reverse transcriptase domain-containing protein [Aphis craccivora]|uniref:Reverse transcriptase domain-containing protein n=1 Tax=Aphis craccivora TaxID=307492 RepID=A0A6G0ZMA9_APHCR|nr:Reverse transcriptase domain-containing protein [Aphis craccivora]
MGPIQIRHKKKKPQHCKINCLIKYIGSIVTEKNETDKEVAKLKTVIFNLNTPSGHLWGGPWTLRKNEERKLMVFERKILRKNFGSVKDRETVGWSCYTKPEQHNNKMAMDEIPVGTDWKARALNREGWKLDV